MVKRKTQLEKIEATLLRFKKVSRNWALRNYITRLSARICDLRDDGHVIKGEYVKGKNGKDFVYRLL